MKKSKLLWFIVLPIVLGTILSLIKFDYLIWYLIPFFKELMFDLYIKMTYHSGIDAVSYIMAFLNIFVLIFISVIVYNLIFAKKKKAVNWLVVLLLIVILNHSGSYFWNVKKENQIALIDSAKKVVTEIVNENPILPDENCTTIKIIDKVDKGVYRAMATMESKTQYYIQIEDLKGYVHVEIIPAFKVTD